MTSVLEAKPAAGNPTAPHPDPYPKVVVLGRDHLLTVVAFARFLAAQGNLNHTHSGRGFLAWASCLSNGNDRAAIPMAETVLHEVKGHRHERELARLVVAVAEYLEAQHGDGSAEVERAVAALRAMGYEPVLNKRRP